MSDTDRPTRTTGRTGADLPRAVIHKHILEVAADRPDASLEELAAAVSGASITLVERVLEEYGDPSAAPGDDSGTGPTTGDTVDPSEPSSGMLDGSDESAGAASTPTAAGSDLSGATHDSGRGTATAAPTGEDDETMNQNGATTANDIDLDDLTEKQRETVRAIAADPTASQADLADRLGVSRATICQRVNGIDGFDWAQRESFVTALLDGDRTNGGTAVTDTKRLDALADRVAALERQVGAAEEQPGVTIADPALVHKVIHACMRADQITQEEELAIIAALLGDGAAT